MTWGVSRAETVRDALRSQGCEARAIALPSVLNYGPVDPPDPDVRQAWIRTVLRCDPDDDQRELEQPWADATSAGVRPVYWVCMTDAAGQASLLEFAFRMAGRPFDLVDATGLDVVTRHGIRKPWSLGIMRREDIIGSGLKDKRRAFSRAECGAAYPAATEPPPVARGFRTSASVEASLSVIARRAPCPRAAGGRASWCGGGGGGGGAGAR